MPELAHFTSILFQDESDLARLETAEEPDYFSDLGLDQLVERLCAKREPFRLEPFFWVTLRGLDEVRYRQQTLRESAREEVRGSLEGFVKGLERTRRQLDLMAQLRSVHQRRRCLLDAASAYCTAVRRLGEELEALDPDSPGLAGLGDYLRRYVASADFADLESDAHETAKAIGSVRYDLHIRGARIRVHRHRDRPDLGHDVAELFARFRDHGQPDDPVPYQGGGGFSHIDAEVLEYVADLHPHEFGLLTCFGEKHAHFLDTVVSHIARETEFVLAWHRLADELAERGLQLALPTVDDGRELVGRDCYDLVLATGMIDRDVVLNDLLLTGDERFLLVTGPNQGGKTTTARTFGQFHHLAAIGCPVAASSARLSLADRIFAQFEREEDPGSHRGKLQDDLIRMHEISGAATDRSVVVLNEVFSSTSTDDALALADRVLAVLLDRGCIGVCVTFLDDVAEGDERVVSMVAEVDPDDPSVRTFRVVRRPADGRAYADAIARKYRLGRDEIKRRVSR